MHRQLIGPHGPLLDCRSLALRGTMRRSLAEHRAIAARLPRARSEPGGAAAARPHPRPPATARGRQARGGRAQAYEPEVRRQPQQPRAADRARLRPVRCCSSWPSGSRSWASTRSGSATASSRSRATSRSRCCRPSRSAQSRVKLGTACMVSATRNPLYLALEWATLDQLSDGRTILGTGTGNPEEGVRREFAALGLDFGKRAAIFEEGLAVIRAALDRGASRLPRRALRLRRRLVLLRHRDGAADAGADAAADLGRLQPAARRHRPRRPPWSARIMAACRRIVRYGDGWMTCCRAEHPEELVEQLDWIRAGRRRRGRRLRPSS